MPGTKLLVSNVSDAVGSHSLAGIFSDYYVQHISQPRQGEVILTFLSPQMAEQAVHDCNGYVIKGQAIRIDYYFEDPPCPSANPHSFAGYSGMSSLDDHASYPVDVEYTNGGMGLSSNNIDIDVQFCIDDDYFRARARNPARRCNSTSFDPSVIKDTMSFSTVPRRRASLEHVEAISSSSSDACHTTLLSLEASSTSSSPITPPSTPPIVDTEDSPSRVKDPLTLGTEQAPLEDLISNLDNIVSKALSERKTHKEEETAHAPSDLGPLIEGFHALLFGKNPEETTGRSVLPGLGYDKLIEDATNSQIRASGQVDDEMKLSRAYANPYEATLEVIEEETWLGDDVAFSTSRQESEALPNVIIEPKDPATGVVDTGGVVCFGDEVNADAIHVTAAQVDVESGPGVSHDATLENGIANDGEDFAPIPTEDVICSASNDTEVGITTLTPVTPAGILSLPNAAEYPEFRYKEAEVLALKGLSHNDDVTGLRSSPSCDAIKDVCNTPLTTVIPATILSLAPPMAVNASDCAKPRPTAPVNLAALLSMPNTAEYQNSLSDSVLEQMIRKHVTPLCDTVSSKMAPSKTTPSKFRSPSAHGRDNTFDETLSESGIMDSHKARPEKLSLREPLVRKPSKPESSVLVPKDKAAPAKEDVPKSRVPELNTHRSSIQSGAPEPLVLGPNTTGNASMEDTPDTGEVSRSTTAMANSNILIWSERLTHMLTWMSTVDGLTYLYIAMLIFLLGFLLGGFIWAFAFFAAMVFKFNGVLFHRGLNAIIKFTTSTKAAYDAPRTSNPAFMHSKDTAKFVTVRTVDYTQGFSRMQRLVLATVCMLLPYSIVDHGIGKMIFLLTFALACAGVLGAPDETGFYVGQIMRGIVEGFKEGQMLDDDGTGLPDGPE